MSVAGTSPKQISVQSEDGAKNVLTITSPNDVPIEAAGDTTGDGQGDAIGEHHSAPMVLIVPGMGISSRSYKYVALALAANGILAISSDLRGNGNSSVKASRSVDYGYREHVEFDFPANIAAIREAFGDRPLFILGHSLGGQLGGLFMAANSGAVQGLIAVASGSIYQRTWPIRSRALLLGMTFGFRLGSQVLGYFPGHRVGFGGSEPKTGIKDWNYQALTGRYDLANSGVDYMALMKELRAPILAASFDSDRWMPKPSVEHFLQMFPKAKTEHWYLSAEDVGKDSVDHISWVRQPEMFVASLCVWIKQQCPSAP